MPKSTWSINDIDFLFKNYSTKSNKELSISLNKKISTIKEYARRKGLIKTYDFNQNRRIGNFSNLLNEIPEAYYWIGFIFADGTLSKKGRLSVTTSWDNEHLEKFAKFVNGKVTVNKKPKSIKNYTGSREIFYSISIADMNRYKELFNKFNINNKKTYFPPDLKFLDIDWKFYSFLIGFIDGDGNITNNSTQIVNHISWKITHEYICEWLNLHNIGSSTTIDSNGESKLYISRKFYYLMKIFIINNKIPAMNRKWNKNIKL
jgi:hypothetical protein